MGLFGLGLWEFLGAGSLSGLWLGLLGWFLLDAATASYVQAELLTGFRGMRVSDLMSNDCMTVPGDMSLKRFADEYVLKTGRRCYAVEDRGRTIGLITSAALAKIEKSRWTDIPVMCVAHPLGEVRSVSPDTPVAEALQTMGQEDLNQLAVVEAGRMEGMLSRSHILRALQTRSELSM